MEKLSHGRDPLGILGWEVWISRVMEWMMAGGLCLEQVILTPTSWAILSPFAVRARPPASMRPSRPSCPQLTLPGRLARNSIIWVSEACDHTGVVRRVSCAPLRLPSPLPPSGGDFGPGDPAPPNPGYVHFHCCSAGHCPHGWWLGSCLRLQERWGACWLLSVQGGRA